MLSPAACGIIFDLDGVIVDTTTYHFESFRVLGEEEGYEITPEIFRSIFGRHNFDIFPILYGHSLPAEEVQRLADRKESLFRDMLRGKVRALPGVAELLPALRDAGFHLAIGSSTPRANIDMILGELGFAGYFEAIASAEDVTEGKPNPQVFLTAAARLGISPALCTVIEDAVAGVQAALNGGMHAVGVTTNHPRESLGHAHRVVDSLAELTPQDLLDLLCHA
ncbi:MAG: HAD family hydrolase [Armatimonadota bacterium]